MSGTVLFVSLAEAFRSMKEEGNVWFIEAIMIVSGVRSMRSAPFAQSPPSEWFQFHNRLGDRATTLLINAPATIAHLVKCPQRGVGGLRFGGDFQSGTAGFPCVGSAQ